MSQPASHPQRGGTRIAIGAFSHGIGTARALHEGRTERAFVGLSVALTALATCVTVPWLVPLLLR